MIPIKIQCGCGQRYSFEVEPINGRMPTTVTCPVCGADGTTVANEIIAQALAEQSQTAPSSSLRLGAAGATAAPVVGPVMSSVVEPRAPVRPHDKFMKRALFTILWLLASFVGGVALLICVTLLVSLTIPRNVDVTQPEVPPEMRGRALMVGLAYYLFLFGLPVLALVLGIRGKLPGTRRKKD